MGQPIGHALESGSSIGKGWIAEIAGRAAQISHDNRRGDPLSVAAHLRHPASLPSVPHAAAAQVLQHVGRYRLCLLWEDGVIPGEATAEGGARWKRGCGGETF